MGTERPMSHAGAALQPPPRHPHRCPWWAGPLLASPIRRLVEKPEVLLAPWVERGATILDVGCAMGFFSLPLARLAGPEGRVLCVDVEPRMMSGLVRRARRAGLLERIETIVCEDGDLGLSPHAGTVDLAVVIHTLHELPDIDRALGQVAAALKPGGRLLLVEPRGHVSDETWDFELAATRRQGFALERRLGLARRFGLVLSHPG